MLFYIACTFLILFGISLWVLGVVLERVGEKMQQVECRKWDEYQKQKENH